MARMIDIRVRVLVGKPEGSILLEDQDGSEMIILKCILNKMGKCNLDSPNSD